MELQKYIRDVQDFPKPGIGFKDITPLLLNNEALTTALDAFIKLVDGQKIDKVVSMESRGFFFGPMIAKEIGAGFVPVRKPGKLPYETIKQEYALEYGTDVLEMHIDAIQQGDRVLIHDDVLATGGTAEAVVKMVEKAGGIVVQLDFLIDLTFLDGKKKLEGHTVNALIEY
ncbi:adenine phosphoribosyltransferase [Flammeovirga kamogawensis]|uniref:Adenine phosphoribosyltransferase n=1 Tax=Flammeovirga kamogawensis TaxID=373891 RepID=A0ABX8H4F5_9BACT|nr:adenine phosphoribosyltransferase [Flammeovirga kamogawensis]MBB6461906.1 adenine phosphoribosyltransferase [Flammeovirga kamogawensis]QWG10484.1 adenine phosphoribosyltransferase [Flammeovirga kamogawensis]TRX63594.1 adenine phosphoribosyltransferase [Flammeovirga kamogawensis]